MEDLKMKEAMFYEKLGDNVVKCNLCCSHQVMTATE